MSPVATETAAPTSKPTSDSDQAGEGVRLCDEIVMSVAEQMARELAEYSSLVARLSARKAGPEDTPERILGLLRKLDVPLHRFRNDIQNGPGTMAHCLDRQLVEDLREELEGLDQVRRQCCERLQQLLHEPQHSQDQLAALLSEDLDKSQRFRYGDPRDMNPGDLAGHELSLKNDIERFSREKTVEIPDRLAAIDRQRDDIGRVIGSLHVRI